MWITIGLLIVIAFLLGYRFLAERSESANEYLDETEDRKYKAPPSGGWSGG